MGNRSQILLLLFIIILTSCDKPKIQYWPPSKYGEKLKKSEENFKNGKKEGLSVWWHVNGNKQIECTYKDGNLNGLFNRWYYNGNPERTDNYINGVLDGASKTFYEEGGIESEMNYKNGILDGIYKLYWENGEIKTSSEYSNGLYSGNWKYYDRIGIKIGEAQFVNGNGNQIEFSLKTGLKIKETNIIKNKKNGVETWWSDSGKKIKEVTYSDDKIIKTIIY